jgi:hypothetical protein
MINGCGTIGGMRICREKKFEANISEIINT